MSTLSRQKTWATSQTFTAADINAEFDNIVDDYNGSVSNDNIAADAAIATSKISGTAVTLAGTETLTNKTLTTPAIDQINEATSAAGVTADGVLLKDSEVTTDVINEKTGATGVTIDSTLLKDGGITLGTTGFFNLGTESELTISSGAITITRSRHSIDTESDDAADSLSTINGGSVGDILLLRQSNNGRDITIIDTANIRLAGNADFVMENLDSNIVLLKTGANWIELSRSI